MTMDLGPFFGGLLQYDIAPLPNWDSDGTFSTFETDTFRAFTPVGQTEIQKCEDDLDRYRELIDISQPDIVIETGTRYGGSALWFRDQGLQVISIDVAPAWRKQPSHLGISFMRGSSLDPAMVSNVLPLIRGKRTMVSLDSDHSSPHVQAEMAMYGPLISPGCYMVVEDGCFDMWEPKKARVGGHGIPKFGGPLHAISTSGIQHNKQWWRDESLEGRTGISHSPAGWWRKHE
jgi:cephalosporin hydroxylase